MNTTPSRKEQLEIFLILNYHLLQLKHQPNPKLKIDNNNSFDTGKPSCVKKLDFGLLTPTKTFNFTSIPTSIYSQAKALFQRGSNVNYSNDYF